MSEFVQYSNQVKNALKDSVKALLSLQKESKLPISGDVMEKVTELLDKQEFSIAVCGSVKQGKSSFINALLGKELLPVADQIATSQLFRISQANEECFELVFTDGTRSRLDNKEDLVKYGTEQPSKLESDPLCLGRTLQWIEVQTPTAFLPPGVHLLDTPGMGAPFSSHAEIVHRYVATADAVIYLKTANTPLNRKETDFIKEIFGITSNILFILSQVDLFEEKTVDTQIERNQKILNDSLSEISNGKSYTFWPLSSKLLFEAAQQTDEVPREMLRKASHFDEVSDALSKLIYKTVGYTVASCAMAETKTYQERLTSTIKEEYNLLQATSVEEKEKIKLAKAEKQRNFNACWGPNGSELKKLTQEFTIIRSNGKNDVAQICNNVLNRFKSEIDNLGNSEIESYSNTLADAVPTAVSDSWCQIIGKFQEKINSIFLRFKIAFDPSSGYYNMPPESLLSTDRELVITSSYEMVRNCTKDAGIGGAIGFCIGAALAPVAFGISEVLGPVIGTIWGFFSSSKKQITDNSARNKKAMKQIVSDYLSELRKNYYEPPFSGGKSFVDEYFETVKSNIDKNIQQIIDNESDLISQELARLDEDAACQEKERIQKLTEKGNYLKRLSGISDTLTSIQDEITAIGKECVF